MAGFSGWAGTGPLGPHPGNGRCKAQGLPRGSGAMRPATLLAAAALLALPLAPPAGAPPDIVVPFRVDQCEYVELILRLPGDRLAPFVGAGFEVRAPGGLGTVVAGVADCASASNATGAGSAAFYWTDIFVNPTDARYVRAGVSVYLWRVENFLTSDLYADAMARTLATHTLADTLEAQGGTAAGTFEVAGAGAFHHGVGAPGADVPTSDGLRNFFREFGPATDGGVSFVEADLTSGPFASGAGVIAAPPGSVAFELFGPAMAGTAALGHAFSFGDRARMGHFPP